MIGERAANQIKVRGDPVNYEITLEATRQQWVLALDMPYSWSLPTDLHGPATAAVARACRSINAYPMTRPRIPITGQMSDINNLFRTWYLRLPDGSNPRTLALARQMRMRLPGPTESMSMRCCSKLNREEEYLSTRWSRRRSAGTPVDRFLFDTRRGFCEHYASAFAVIDASCRQRTGARRARLPGR